MKTDFNKQKVDNLLKNKELKNKKLTRIIDSVNELTDKEYWYGLGAAYKKTGEIWFPVVRYKELFLYNRNHREYLMTVDERRILQGLPDRVTIYRQMCSLEKAQGNYGVSWALQSGNGWRCKDYFMDYPEKNELSRELVALEVDKKDIIACFKTKNFLEVIYVHNTFVQTGDINFSRQTFIDMHMDDIARVYMKNVCKGKGFVNVEVSDDYKCLSLEYKFIKENKNLMEEVEEDFLYRPHITYDKDTAIPIHFRLVWSDTFTKDDTSCIITKNKVLNVCKS